MNKQGLDRAYAPDAQTGKAMLAAISGSFWGIYIGGPYSGGHGWTPQLIKQYQDAGVPGFLPYYVGHQNDANPTTGAADGHEAGRLMRSFGFPLGSIVCYDFEAGAFNAVGAAGTAAVFANWTQAVKAEGYSPGIYSSPAGCAAAIGHGVDFIVPAQWVAHGVIPSIDPHNIPGFSNSALNGPGQRAWQYGGGPAFVNGLAVDIVVADLHLATVGGSVTPVQNPPVPTPVAPAQPLPVRSGYTWYTIQSGDSMSALAQRWGVSLQNLEAMNADIVPNPNLIIAGHSLRAPSHIAGPPAPPVAHVHTVAGGESLSVIAFKEHTTVASIVAKNTGKYPSLARNPNLIYPGWQLVI